MRVVVARVGRALGVKGDLLVDVLTDEPERRLFAGADVHIMGSGRTLRIESERPHGGRLCLHFAGIDDRSAAESLTGSMLEAERAEFEAEDHVVEGDGEVLLVKAACPLERLA